MNQQPYSDVTRRGFLGRGSQGLGGMVLASMLAQNARAEPGERQQGMLDQLHYPARAKRVIFMVMAGGMSHLETLDHKPKLAEMHSQPMPDSFTKGQPIAQLQGKKLTCFAPQHAFQKHGDNGQEISAIFPSCPACWTRCVSFVASRPRRLITIQPTPS